MRKRSPCPIWNSVSGGSVQSIRSSPRCGRWRDVVTFPSCGMQSTDSVEFRRNTSSPPGRSRRAASGIHLRGSHQIEAPYSETARSNDADGRPVCSALASISSRPRPVFSFIRRAVASCAGVTSTPTTRRAPRFLSHAPTYAVPQPSSTTSLPRTLGSTLTSRSGVFQTPQLISASLHACSARRSV